MVEKRPLGKTELSIPPVVFGGNVFGWTLDEKASFALLDGCFARGLTAIDTADSYSHWAEGNSGGESETIIGNWLAANPDKRDNMLIFTKVGSTVGGVKRGLSAKWIAQGVEDSLRRLKTDRIDLYFAHKPDPDTPFAETLEAFDKLKKAGKIRAVGASNLDAAQLGESLDVAKRHQLQRYDVLQPEYNLYDRQGFEGPLRELVVREDIGVITYFSLASGFLTGKYRTHLDITNSRRAPFLGKYMTPRGARILEAVGEVAERTGAAPAEVAIAWLIAQGGVTAPIASATSLDQLDSLANAATLKLSREDIVTLDTASGEE
jgi:aryl-alcohol dehydrogenase-like predicted oxidoreductase